MLLLLLVYPFIIITHIERHEFLELAMFHMAVIGLLAFVYHFAPSVRALPPWLRVTRIAFLPMTVLMPVATSCSRPSGCSRSTAQLGDRRPRRCTAAAGGQAAPATHGGPHP